MRTALFFLLTAGLLVSRPVRAQEPAAPSESARHLLSQLRGHAPDTAAIRLQLALADALASTDADRANSVLRQARALAHRLGDGAREGVAWEQAGNLAITTGRFDDALAAEARALPLLRRAGNRLLEFDAYAGQGIARMMTGDLTGATRSFLASLRLAEALHDPERTGKALNNLGNVEFRLTRLPEAEAYYRRFLRVATDPAPRAGAFVNLANIALRREQADTAPMMTTCSG